MDLKTDISSFLYTVTSGLSEELYSALVCVPLKNATAVTRMFDALPSKELRVYWYRQHEAQRNSALVVALGEGLQIDCQHRPVSSLHARCLLLTKSAVYS
jgi:hypothetical protein